MTKKHVKIQAWSGFKLFDNLMVYLKEFFQKVNFEKNQQTTKEHLKITQQAKRKLRQ